MANKLNVEEMYSLKIIVSGTDANLNGDPEDGSRPRCGESQSMWETAYSLPQPEGMDRYPVVSPDCLKSYICKVLGEAYPVRNTVRDLDPEKVDTPYFGALALQKDNDAKKNGKKQSVVGALRIHPGPGHVDYDTSLVQMDGWATPGRNGKDTEKDMNPSHYEKAVMGGKVVYVFCAEYNGHLATTNGATQESFDALLSALTNVHLHWHASKGVGVFECLIALKGVNKHRDIKVHVDESGDFRVEHPENAIVIARED